MGEDAVRVYEERNSMSDFLKMVHDGNFTSDNFVHIPQNCAVFEVMKMAMGWHDCVEITRHEFLQIERSGHDVCHMASLF
jgi:hypothetical protein